MIFKKILNCFFPSFNSKIEISKIETWVICEHKTHPPTSPTQHTNTPNDPPKIKTLITHKHTTHSLDRRVTHSLDSQIIKKKKKKKRGQAIRQSNSHTLTDSHFHIKKKKKKVAEGGRTYKL